MKSNPLFRLRPLRRCSRLTAALVATLALAAPSDGHHPDRENQRVTPVIDVIGPIGNRLPPSYRFRYNRPTYIGGKIAYHIAPSSQEAMAWHRAVHAGAYKKPKKQFRLEQHYFYPKPWEALTVGPRRQDPEATVQTAPGMESYRELEMPAPVESATAVPGPMTTDTVPAEPVPAEPITDEPLELSDPAIPEASGDAGASEPQIDSPSDTLNQRVEPAPPAVPAPPAEPAPPVIPEAGTVLPPPDNASRADAGPAVRTAIGKLDQSHVSRTGSAPKAAALSVADRPVYLRPVRTR